MTTLVKRSYHLINQEEGANQTPIAPDTIGTTGPIGMN